MSAELCDLNVERIQAESLRIADVLSLFSSDGRDSGAAASTNGVNPLVSMTVFKAGPRLAVHLNADPSKRGSRSQLSSYTLRVIPVAGGRDTSPGRLPPAIR